MSLISVVIPCFNEAGYIEECLRSVVDFELPDGDELEILVVDGRSTDDTADRVRALSAKDGRIRLLENPARFAPHGMNIGIAAARGEFVARLDAHSIYPRNYLAVCLATSRRTGADNVGGVCVTRARGDGFGARVVRALTTHKFGVGDSEFRTGGVEGPADTVPYGFFRRTVFERIGMYDERLIRAQDYEFNRRITRNHGQVWMNPEIHMAYYQQPTVRAFLKKQIVLEAPYNAYLWFAAPYAFTPRHAVTAVFAAGVLGGIVLSSFVVWIKWIFLAVMALYALLALASAVQQARRYGEPLLLIALPFGFFSYHFLHGLGVLWGLVRLATRTAPVMRPATSAADSRTLS